jgi:IS5 family transposase
MQLFYNLSDPAMEDALYEIESMCRFAWLNLSGTLPDETTILKFRHLLEQHRLGKEILKQVNRHLEKEGLLLREGTNEDARLSRHPLPPRIRKERETRRCTRPRKTMSGTLG